MIRPQRLNYFIPAMVFITFAAVVLSLGCKSTPKRDSHDSSTNAAHPAPARTASPVSEPTVIGFAVLPADSFVAGPTSGQFIKPSNKRKPPFVNQQPIQGVSGVIHGQTPGSILLLSDNGFGGKGNSADYLLAVYQTDATALTSATDARPLRKGTVNADIAFHLSDPDRKILWKLVADHATYPNGGGDIPVDPRIRENHLLTGADFDLESFRKMPDGTFYFGDEFGPFLLHTDGQGRLLDAPISLPGRWAPQHPQRKNNPINVPGSGGFEGMAISPEGHLLPMLERPVNGAKQRHVEIFRFDPKTKTYAFDGRPIAHYPLDRFTKAIGEFVHVGGDRYLVLERDNGQADKARDKKIYLVDFSRADANAVLKKKLVVDLMDISERRGLSPYDRFGRLGMPFVTIESILILHDRRIMVVNDNNYPFSVGRHAHTTGEPDDTEFVVIELPESLKMMKVD